MTIKAVVFDFGGVILSYESAARLWREMDEKHGLPENTVSSEIKGASFTAWCGGSNGLFTGGISVQEVEEGLFTKYINEKYNCSIEGSLKPMSPILTDLNYIRYSKKICAILQQLKDSGFKIALLTNNCHMDKDHKEQRLPFDLSIFDVVVESCVEQVMKPEPEIYKIAQDRLQLEPQELVFLDDLQENCETAINLGWQAIQVDLAKEDETVQQLQQMLDIKFSFND